MFWGMQYAPACPFEKTLALFSLNWVVFTELKVSWFRKNVLVSPILPKNEQKQVDLSYHSIVGWFFFIAFWKNSEYVPISPFKNNWSLWKRAYIHGSRYIPGLPGTSRDQITFCFCIFMHSFRTFFFAISRGKIFLLHFFYLFFFHHHHPDTM